MWTVSKLAPHSMPGMNASVSTPWPCRFGGCTQSTRATDRWGGWNVSWFRTEPEPAGTAWNRAGMELGSKRSSEVETCCFLFAALADGHVRRRRLLGHTFETTHAVDLHHKFASKSISHNAVAWKSIDAFRYPGLQRALLQQKIDRKAQADHGREREIEPVNVACCLRLCFQPTNNASPSHPPNSQMSRNDGAPPACCLPVLCGMGGAAAAVAKVK